MTEFTPGLWTVHPSESTVVEIPGGHPSTVFAAYCGTEANARLIAAAPDMLATLYFVRDHLTMLTADYKLGKDKYMVAAQKRTRAAIARACGQ